MNFSRLKKIQTISLLALTFIGTFPGPGLATSSTSLESSRRHALAQVNQRLDAIQAVSQRITNEKSLPSSIKDELNQNLTESLPELNHDKALISKDKTVDNINRNLQKAIDLKILRVAVPRAEFGLSNEVMYALTKKYTQFLLELKDYNDHNQFDAKTRSDTAQTIAQISAKVGDAQDHYGTITDIRLNLGKLSDPERVSSIQKATSLINQANLDLDSSDTSIQVVLSLLKKNKEAIQNPAPLLEPTYEAPKSTTAHILMYHYVRSVDPVADPLGFRLSVLPAQLEQQLINFKRLGYSTISMADLAAGKGNPSALILTFDDGYADFYTDAYPLLKKYGLTATVYIITAKVGSNHYMSWDQIKELQSQGFEVGAHTVNHYELNKLPEDQQKFEIEQSKRTLEEQLGHPVTTFCYPVGRYDDTTVRLVKAAGFLTATTTNPGSVNQGSDMFRLSRVRVSPYSRFDTKLYKFGTFSRVKPNE